MHARCRLSSIDSATNWYKGHAWRLATRARLDGPQGSTRRARMRLAPERFCSSGPGSARRDGLIDGYTYLAVGCEVTTTTTPWRDEVPLPLPRRERASGASRLFATTACCRCALPCPGARRQVVALLVRRRRLHAVGVVVCLACSGEAVRARGHVPLAYSLAPDQVFLGACSCLLCGLHLRWPAWWHNYFPSV